MPAWASCQIRKIVVYACAGNAKNVFPATDFKKSLVSDPGMHHGTCVTHVPRCMSGSLNCGGGKNVPDILGTCAIYNFTYLARDTCIGDGLQCAALLAEKIYDYLANPLSDVNMSTVQVSYHMCLLTYHSSATCICTNIYDSVIFPALLPIFSIYLSEINHIGTKDHDTVTWEVNLNRKPRY